MAPPAELVDLPSDSHQPHICTLDEDDGGDQDGDGGRDEDVDGYDDEEDGEDKDDDGGEGNEDAVGIKKSGG